MKRLEGKSIVVVGGSRGVGKRVVEMASDAGAKTLAVARDAHLLQQLVARCQGVDTLPLDATEDDSPSRVFDRLQPDILVLCAGAFPAAAPLYEQDWSDFSTNWEVDTKITFLFCKAALSRPLLKKTRVIIVSSGAALAGSPLTGGYAGAKRTQMFIANYSQKESLRLGLGLDFVTVAPRIIPDSDLGHFAVCKYSQYLGMSEMEFVQGMDAPPSTDNVAEAIIQVACQIERTSDLFVVSGRGLEAVPQG